MTYRVAAIFLAASLVAIESASGCLAQSTEHMTPTEAKIPAGNTTLYTRAVGKGTPIIVLHGGPDFDSGYLLPELDRLGSGYRLIYYDQRGRGKSVENVNSDDVTLTSDLEDIDRVISFYKIEKPILLGHSWGAVLALEYAVRHPERISRLILMNPAPVSATDLAEVRKKYLERLGTAMDQQREIVASEAYKSGDPETVAARYRIHFKPSLKHPADYEKMMERMKAGFVSQGKEGIIKARAVEDRLMLDTWSIPEYDLSPKLRQLKMPTLVIAGDHDFMSLAADRIAGVIPRAKLVTIKDCGHFAFLECPKEVRRSLDTFVKQRH